MEITERKMGNVCVVGVAGRLDSGTSESFGQQLHHLIDGGIRSFVVDGATLEYVSSAGLRVLLVAAKRLKAANGRIVLSSLKPHILEVFEIAGFTSIFPTYGNVEQAVQQVQQKPG